MMHRVNSVNAPGPEREHHRHTQTLTTAANLGRIILTVAAKHHRPHSTDTQIRQGAGVSIVAGSMKVAEIVWHGVELVEIVASSITFQMSAGLT